ERRQLWLDGGAPDHVQDPLDLTTRVFEQDFVVVERVAEAEQLVERALERQSVDGGRGAEVVQHDLERRARREIADADRRALTAYAERRRLVFEVRGCSTLPPQARTPPSLRDAPVGLLEIDAAGDVVGERDVALALGDTRGSILAMALHV